MKAMFLTAALIGATAITAPAMAAPMETMTVIYRSPLDYALYQQKAEMLGYFYAELDENIRTDARTVLHQMAKDFVKTNGQLAKRQPQGWRDSRMVSAPQ